MLIIFLVAAGLLWLALTVVKLFYAFSSFKGYFWQRFIGVGFSVDMLDFVAGLIIPFFGAGLTGGSVLGYATGAVASLAFSIIVHTNVHLLLADDNRLASVENKRRWRCTMTGKTYRRTWVSAYRGVHAPDLVNGYTKYGCGAHIKV